MQHFLFWLLLLHLGWAGRAGLSNSTPHARSVWPGFRGAGDSHTAAQRLPLRWSDFDAKTRVITRSEAFTDEYKLVDGVWFPASRRLTRAENGKVITRLTEFQNPRLRFNSEQAER